MGVKTTVQPLTIRGVNGEYFMRLRAQVMASIHAMVASIFKTDQPYEDYPWLHESPTLVKWEGERTMRRLQSEKITIVNDEYETGVAFKKRDFTRDKTQQMQARVQEMAINVAGFPTDLLTSLILANGTAYDNVAYFSGSHSVGSSGTIDNDLIAAELQSSSGVPTVEQQAANLITCLSRMLGFRNAAGRPMNEVAKEFVVMVPAALYGVTVAAINAAFVNNGVSNPLGELKSSGGIKITPVLNARLTDPTKFYFFRVDAGIRPFIVQEEDTTPVELGLDSEHCAKTNEVYFGHGWTGGIGYGRFELAIRANLT